jgi:N-acetylglucosaminyldiphosphoundecaprenol N-acetyl-beta-D-mannosaminyltransferase
MKPGDCSPSNSKYNQSGREKERNVSSLQISVPATQSFRTVTIGRLPTAVVTAEEMAAQMVADCIAARKARANGQPLRPKVVFSSNGQGVSLAGDDADFRAIMLQADMIHADGMSVVFASRLLGKPLPERVATTDFFHNAARSASLTGLRFYMLGASEAQNMRACQAVKAMYPDLQIVGRRNGYFSRDDEEAICKDIVASGADVLWIALGKPKQEEFCVRNREMLRGIGWLKTCGGLYAFLAGADKRAPLWMQKAGFEWAYRACQNPRRLVWRYLSTNPRAFAAMLFASQEQR